MNLLNGLKLKGRVLCNEPLSRHTTFRIGGSVKIWAEPSDIEDMFSLLEISKEENMPIFLIGDGTNLLVSDEGLDMIAVSLRRGFTRISSHSSDSDKTRICAGAGLNLQKFVLNTIDGCYSGLEFMAGIPGTIGGAVRMNAGAGLGGPWISDFIYRVKVLGPAGIVRYMERKAIRFGYRNSGLGDFIILEVEFNIKGSGDPELSRQRYKKFLMDKKKKQELSMPGAGCVFKNPRDSKSSAAQLIEGCNLKGKRIGDAMISDKHANFIVNLGKATFKEVTELIDLARDEVLRKHNIALEPEIKILK